MPGVAVLAALAVMTQPLSVLICELDTASVLLLTKVLKGLIMNPSVPHGMNKLCLHTD